jgi:hypothetical protein
MRYYDYKIKEDEMGGACGSNGKGKKAVKGFGWKT